MKKPAATVTVTGQASRRATAAAIAGAITGLLSVGAIAQPAPSDEEASVPRARPVFTPGIVTSLMYTDNVLHLPDADKTDDVVFEASPYVIAESTTPRADYFLYYQMRNLWRLDGGDSALYRHSLDGYGNFSLVQDRLWVDLHGFMGYVNNTADGRLSGDPIGSFTNSSAVRRISVSPYYASRIGSAADVGLRYYVATTSDASQYAVASVDQRLSGYVAGVDERQPRWNWRVSGEAQRRGYDDNIVQDRSLSAVTLYYRLTPRLRLSGSVEYEHIDEVRNRDGETDGYGPALGFEWRPNPRTAVDGSIAHRYYGNVANARASYTPGFNTFGVQLSRSVTSSVDESLLLLRPRSLVNTGSDVENFTLESLIAAGLVSRTGVPLTDGLVTDAPVFDERITVFYGLRRARNAFAVAAFASDRSSVDTLATAAPAPDIAVDSPIGIVFAGKQRERGIITHFQHRLNVISSVEMRVDWRDVSSPTAGFKNELIDTRVVYMRRLGPRTTAFGGVRYARQSSNDPTNEYSERTVYAGLDVRFR